MPRTLLNGPANFAVDPINGSDSGCIGPFKSFAYGWYALLDAYDLCRQNVTFQGAPGVYPNDFSIQGQPIGLSGNPRQITFRGDPENLSNYVLRPGGSARVFCAQLRAQAYLEGFLFDSSQSSADAVIAASSAWVGLGKNTFGPVGSNQKMEIQPSNFSEVWVYDEYEINHCALQEVISTSCSTQYGGDPARVGVSSPGGISAGLYVNTANVQPNARVKSILGAVVSLDANCSLYQGSQNVLFSEAPFSCAGSHVQMDPFSVIWYLPKDGKTLQVQMRNTPIYGQPFASVDNASCGFDNVKFTGEKRLQSGAQSIYRNGVISPNGRVPFS